MCGRSAIGLDTNLLNASLNIYILLMHSSGLLIVTTILFGCHMLIIFKVRCSSMVERPLKVRWVVGSIPHGGSSELFLVSSSVLQLM